MRARTWILLLIALAVAALAGLALGPVALSPGAVWSALLGHGDGNAVAIVQTLRLPRIPLGVVIGAGLGVSGAALAVTLVLLVARAAGARGDPRVLLMGGVVVGAFANAAVMVLLAGAPTETVRGALWWMMGSLSDATWQGTRWVAAYVAVGAAMLLALGR